MGLTVHYKLTALADLTEAEAKQLVESLRRLAMRFYCEGWVDKVFPITSDSKTLRKFAPHWLSLPVPGRENVSTGVEVSPEAGFLFGVSVGADCEPLWLGLCRYPEKVWYDGRDVRSMAGRGWRYAGFSKTQFASLHGWEHFMRCHCAVVHLLAACRSPELRVKISDEGDYWPRRSLKALRQNLDQMNGIVAAAAGALKDCSPEATGENAVQSPIFAHRQFERLEAEGAGQFEVQLKKLRTLIGKRQP